MTNCLFPRPLMRRAGMALAAALAALPAGAATLTNVNASNVIVNGAAYDVEFLVEVCPSTEYGCDAPIDLVFTTQADATAAGTALADLFEAPGNEEHDDDPTMTSGCQANAKTDPCITFTPYYVEGVTLTGIGFYNEPATSATANYLTQLVRSGTGPWHDLTYAVWSVADLADPAPAPVPLPAPLLLLGAALTALAAAGIRARA